MKMKRFAAAMLAAMMTVSLGACGQSSDDAKQTSESKSSGKTTVERNAERACIWNRIKLSV